MRWSRCGAALWTSAVAVAIVLTSMIPTAALAQEAEPTAEELEEQIRELRLQASYGEAAEVARALVALRMGDPEAQEFEIADAAGLVKTLQDIAGLSDEARRELASADSLAAIVSACKKQGRFADGIPAAEQRLAIQRQRLGEDHQEVATSINDLGMLTYGTGDYPGAEQLFTESLSIRRRVLGESHPQVAGSISNVALTRQLQGDYGGAEKLYREALAIRAELRGPTSETASTMNNLATVLENQGKYEESESLHRETLAVLIDLHGGDDDLQVATALNNRGLVLQSRGDYAGAEALMRASLAMRRRLVGGFHVDTANSLTCLGNVLREQGDYVGAEQLMRESRDIVMEVLGEEHPYSALTSINLASVLHSLQRSEESERLFRDALALSRKLFGDEHSYVAAALTNLAMVLADQERYDEAEPLNLEAFETTKRLFGEEHPRVAVSLNNLAKLTGGRRDYEAAADLLAQSLRIRRQALGNSHPYVAGSLRRLGAAYRATGNYGSAEPLFSEAAKVYDVARTRAGRGLKRVTFELPPYADLADALLVLGETSEAWPVAEKASALVLADLLLQAEHRAISPAQATVEDSLSHLLSDLEDALATYQQAAKSDTATGAIERARETRDRLLDAEAKWEELQEGFRAAYPVTEGQVYSLSRVQRALNDATAIIGWLDVAVEPDRYSSWGYVVRRSGPVTWFRLSSPDDPGAASPMTARSSRDVLSDPEAPLQVTRQVGRALWNARIGLLLGSLEGVDDLIVIPSGIMMGTPVEALVDETGTLLGQRYAVSYAPSATIHTWLTERGEQDGLQGSPRALLVGDPPFNEAHLQVMLSEGYAAASLESAEPFEAVVQFRGALAGNEEALASLPRLPGSRTEVRETAAVMPKASVLIGPHASEQRLADLAERGELRKNDIIHIATHALVDDERPERSALVLSQVDLPDPLEAAMAGTRIYDGLVTAREIVKEWDLNADLVTLSACETGLGKEVIGEGYVGFAHAFLQAGARSLLVSLWKVEDKATSLLMRRFYENWLGEYTDERIGLPDEAMPKAEALREAKRWLRDYIDEYGNRPYEHPYYWSAFILIGDRS